MVEKQAKIIARVPQGGPRGFYRWFREWEKPVNKQTPPCARKFFLRLSEKIF